VWAGKEILVCCGRIVGAGASAGAYDPEADQWRDISAPPISTAFAEAIWTGEEMLVFGGVGQGGTTNLVGAAAYDPMTDTWRRLADLPYGLERTADATIGNGVVYAWPSPSQGTTRMPIAYAIASDEWVTLPNPPTPDPSTPSLVWMGDLLFAYGAVSEPGGGVVGIGVTFEPVSQTWTLAQPAPLEPVSPSEGTDASQKAVRVDGEVYIWTGWVGTDWEEPITRVLAYEPSQDSWRELEPAPIAAQGLWHEPIIWTGSQLITYTDPMLVFTP
jgi:N-acetylneuraminic acid mutarotase